MERVTPVDRDTLAQINHALKDVNVSVSMSMAYIRKIQRWSFDDLAKRFDGLSKVTLERYLQPSYPKMRPLHFVAAYSWLTMVPMPSFYRGLNIKEAYRGMDNQAVEAMLYCGLLPKRQFGLVLEHLYEYLSSENKIKVDQFIHNLRETYGSLDNYDDGEFMFPAKINMNDFAYDYYRSVALAFKEFRSVNKLSVATLAKVLNLSEGRYKKCEDPETPVSLPVDIGARLKLGFQLHDAMPFTSHMKKYPQFHKVRLIQHMRETKLVEIMRYLDESYKDNIISMIANMSSIYTRSLK